MTAFWGGRFLRLTLEAPCTLLFPWRGRHATCISCRVGGKPLWCLCHDSHTEIVIKSARTATLTHTNMMPSVSPAALQTSIHCHPSHCCPLRLALSLARCVCVWLCLCVCVCVCATFTPILQIIFFPSGLKLLQKLKRSVILSICPCSIDQHLLTVRVII